MARRTFAQIHFVPQLCQFLDWIAQLIVTHALVTFHLAYCCVFYMELPMKTSQALLVQNVTVQLAMCLCPCHTTTLKAALVTNGLLGRT